MREINLLPPARKGLLEQEEVLRLAGRLVRAGLAGLGFLTVLGLSLLGFFHLAPRPTQTSQDVAQHLTELRTELRSGQQLLDWVQRSDAERVVWSERLPELFARLPADVTVQRIEASMNEQQLRLVGLASHRGALTQIRDRLNELPWVEQVESPLSNLLVADNPSFQFVLRLTAVETTASSAEEGSAAVPPSEVATGGVFAGSTLYWSGIVLVAGGAILLLVAIGISVSRQLGFSGRLRG